MFFLHIFWLILLFSFNISIAFHCFHSCSIIREKFCTPSYKMELLAQTPSIELYGSSQTRSPLVNWYLLELNIPFIQKPPRPSGHPFGQIPFLTDNLDEGKVEIFESGAILLYLADKYDSKCTNAFERAKYSKWIVWANSELDSLCFGKGMSGTQLDKPNKQLDVLDRKFADQDFIEGSEFSVADIAIASYLNYVPLFFRQVSPKSRPNIIRYMIRMAQRPAFQEAFGVNHSEIVLRKMNACLVSK